MPKDILEAEKRSKVYFQVNLVYDPTLTAVFTFYSL